MSPTVDILVAFLVASALVGLLARRVKTPYPILLVFSGLILSFIPGLPALQLRPELIFLIFLPPLLFPAALFTPWRDFRENLGPILYLAIGLVLFTTLAVGLLVHYLIGLPLAVSFVFGAIVSPPDAIAAKAIAERLSVPRRIITILEGESLVNDATALVAYRFALAAAATGSFALDRAVAQFFIAALGGVAVGLAFGWVAAWFHNRVDDAPVEVTVSLLTPFAAYIVAERLHLSGVLSVVTAGLFLGWRNPIITNSRTRLLGEPFWKMVEFLLNGVVFILIGLKTPDAFRGLTDYSTRQLLAWSIAVSLAVILVRICWVFPAMYLPALLSKRIRARDGLPAWQHVAIIAWTGMRGVVSVAAALALPLTLQNGAPFPGRDLILFLTLVVIFATLVLQGLCVPLLIHLLGVRDDKSAENEEREARLKANRAALAHLQAITQPARAQQEALDRLRIEYDDRIRQLEAYQHGRAGKATRIFSEEYETLTQQTLQVERDVILKLRNESVINDDVLRSVQRDIDLAEARLKQHQ